MLVRKRVFVLLVILLVLLPPLRCKGSLEDWILDVHIRLGQAYLQLQFVVRLPFNFKHMFVAAFQTREFPEVHSMMTVLIYN